jgi:hypothetical protein
VAGDPFKHVQAGEPLRVSATAYNAMLDAALAHHQSQLTVGAGPSQLLGSDQAVVLVRNDTGVDVPRFGVVGLDAPLILPADNELEFAARVTFRGVLPSANTRGRFAVLQEPLPMGKIGRAVIAGVTIARITISAGDTDFRWADVQSAATGSLRPDPDGAAQILWLKSQDEGEHWCAVRIGPERRTCVFPVVMLKISGDAGSADGPATWRYAVQDALDTSVVYDMDLNPVGLPHTCRRPDVGMLTYATAGLAYFSRSGDFILTWCNETIEQEAC